MDENPYKAPQETQPEPTPAHRPSWRDILWSYSGGCLVTLCAWRFLDDPFRSPIVAGLIGGMLGNIPLVIFGYTWRVTWCVMLLGAAGIALVLWWSSAP